MVSKNTVWTCTGCGATASFDEKGWLKCPCDCATGGVFSAASPPSLDAPAEITPTEKVKMKRYRRREKTIEAITFDELVEEGKATGAPLTRGMPWSFNYRGYPITHENDNCYLIPAPGLTMRFNRGDMLVIEKHQIYPLPPDTFAYFYEPAGQDVL